MVKRVPPLPNKINRVKGRKYIFERKIVIWSGKILWCKHKRQRSQCKDCGGSSICEHKRQRFRCKDCGGSSICEHGRRRSQCKDCGGSSICEHGRQRSQCKDCGGSSLCEHKRQRSRCKDCGGSSLCEHGRRRSQCKDCGGSSICEHGRQRSQCKDCCPAELQYERFCHVCGEKEAKRRKYGTPGVCAQCDESIPERIEHKVKDYLLSKLPPPSANDNKLTGTECGESKRRADLVWIGQDRVIQVEIDEDEHKNRSVDCELAKMDSSKWGLHYEDQCKPMVFVRFNPDGCQTEEEFCQRCSHLVCVVEQHLTMQMSNTLKTRVCYLYYSDTNKHLLAANEKEHFIVNNIKDI